MLLPGQKSMKELMSPPACKGLWGVGAPTVLSQQPAHTQPRCPATCLCHSYTDHATSRATLLPCSPQMHTAPLAPRHRDPCKERPPSLDQHHHMCARTSPQPSMGESGSDGIPKGISPSPSPGRTRPDSLPDSCCSHTSWNSPVPKASPQTFCSHWLRQAPRDPTLPSQLFSLPSDHQGP